MSKLNIFDESKTWYFISLILPQAIYSRGRSHRRQTCLAFQGTHTQQENIRGEHFPGTFINVILS